MKVLALCGSLRTASTNAAVLRLASRMAPADLEVRLSQAIGELPLFNPDLEASPPPAVVAFHAEMNTADALLIASPEYAHGVTGVIKNALDWVVSLETFDGTPVAVLNASPRARHADEALRETLRTMSAALIGERSFLVPAGAARISEEQLMGNPEIIHAVTEALDAVRIAILTRRQTQPG